MKTAHYGRTFSAEIRFGKCLPHIEQTSLRHRGVSTSRLPGPSFPEPLLMLVRKVRENEVPVKNPRISTYPLAVMASLRRYCRVSWKAS